MNTKELLKFGVEIELKSLDNRDFSIRPLVRGEEPHGISKVAKIVSEIGVKVDIRGWEHNHDNETWICKPDSSCGIELCSPVFERGNFQELTQVLNALQKHPEIKIDDRCSFHVHIGITSGDLVCFASPLAWWIKCEHLFVDSVPRHRKQNKYCRFIGKTSLFNDFELVLPDIIIGKLSDKYLTANSFHFFNKKRSSLEFRLCEGTKDPSVALNWIDVILNFVDRAIHKGLPEDYRWMTVKEIFDFLDFDSVNKICLKKWLAERLLKNMDFSDYFRAHVFKDYAEIYRSTFGQTPSFIVSGRDK